jgi:transcriptional regulator with XRE-family HTH domain
MMIGWRTIMPTEETLGAMLRRLRIAAGFDTPEAAAAACGVSPTAYQAWELDGRPPPDLIASYRVAKRFNVPLEELAICLLRQRAAGPKAALRTAPAGRRTGRKMPGKPLHRR